MNEREREQTEEYRERQDLPDEYVTRQEYLSEKSPDQLEDEIDRIRRDMDQTLSAIEQKLSPGEIIDRSLHYFRGGPGEYISNLGDSVKNKPLPVALVGIGLSWLMLAGSGRAPARSASYHRSGAMREKIGQAREKWGQAREKGEEMQGRVSGRMSETAGRARETVADVSHTVSERMHRVGEKARSTRSSAREWTHRIGEAGQRSSERMHRARGNFSQAVDRQPLLLGVLGIAAGALVGAMLPQTRQEDVVLGPAKERMKEQAVETGREQMAKGQAIAAAAAEAAREESERQLH